MWSDFLWATMYKCFEGLQTVLSELIIFFSAVLHYQRHNSLNMLTKSMACLSTVEQDIKIKQGVQYMILIQNIQYQ
jgi:hypothetical protein